MQILASNLVSRKLVAAAAYLWTATSQASNNDETCDRNACGGGLRPFGFGLGYEFQLHKTRSNRLVQIEVYNAANDVAGRINIVVVCRILQLDLHTLDRRRKHVDN